MGDVPVFPDGGEGIYKFQGIVFLRFIVVQVLGNDRVLRVAEVIEVVLDEAFRFVPVTSPLRIALVSAAFSSGVPPTISSFAPLTMPKSSGLITIVL